MKILSKILHILHVIFAPIRCVVCGKLGSYICSLHEKSLLGYPTCCGYCNTPTTYTQNCYEHENIKGISGLIIGFYYTNLVSYIVHRAKYAGAYHLFSYFAQKLALLIHLHLLSKSFFMCKPIVITYIPMYFKKEYYQRGYNQAQKLAEYIASELSIPCIPLLQKTVSTSSQTIKSRKDRQKSANIDVFKIIPSNISPNSLILLVDDIVTTGSTLSNASKIIKNEYPLAIIWGICVARNT